MNAFSLMINAVYSFMPQVASNSWMDQVGRSLGISGDPQGFFLYLLIMLGIFIVISILIYNWLEERRFNKQVESNFSTIEEDALLDDKQQQFFDKFASTTGVLNDQPPEGTFIDENGEALEDDRSIEDVYAELLETMSKRNRQEKVEPDGITIDHQRVEVTSEPVLDIPDEGVALSRNQEPKIYIPQPAEVSDVEFTESNTKLSASVEEEAINLTFDDGDVVSMPVDVEADPAHSFDNSQSNASAAAEESIIESLAEAPAPAENDIKAIINRAFKEKYNPNFKAEQEALKAQNEPPSEVPTSEPELEIEEAPIEELVLDERAEIEEEGEAGHALPEVVEESAPLETTEIEMPPVVTETVEAEEAPILNFPVEEVTDQAEATQQAMHVAAAEEADALDFLKGLDEEETKPILSFEEELTAPEPEAELEPPILDEPIAASEESTEAPEAQSEEPVESLSQTYQQLLNRDASTNANVGSDAPIASFETDLSQPDTQTAADSSASHENESSNSVEDNKEEKTSASETAAEKVSVFSEALPAHLNQHIDLIGTIEAAKGSNAAFILESFSTFHQQFEFPVFVFMQSEQNQWLFLNDVTEGEIAGYLVRNKPVHITASIQMADRTGPISRNTIQRFKQSLSEAAVTMGAEVKWVDQTDPIDRAASLDAFCIEVDKTMFFHLANTKTPFTGIKLKGLVESQGMVLEKDGSYKYYDMNTESGIKRAVPDFVLFNRDNHKFTEEMLRSSVIKAVTMQLDIPLVPTSAAALDRMVVIAQSLESSLNAQLVDDKNRPITDVHLARIRDQIKSIHAAMQLRGITPGSTHAQRLFS